MIVSLIESESYQWFDFLSELGIESPGDPGGDPLGDSGSESGNASGYAPGIRFKVVESNKVMVLL